MPCRFICVLILCLTTPLAAQVDYRKHILTLGGGAAMPAGELKQYMATRPAMRIGYGYRLHRCFQADIAVEGVFGAAGVKVSQQSPIGELKLRDSETLVPFGGRAILPLAQGRIEFHGGGGGAYLHYGEEVEVPRACLPPAGW